LRTGVIGAGAWGTALANLLARNGRRVRLWAFEPEVAEEINDRRRNSLYLAGIDLHPGLKASSDLDEVIEGAEALVLVTPSHVLRTVAGRLAGRLPPEALVVTATKGIEEDSLLTMSGVLAEILGQGVRERLGALSGPSFAQEVAADLPTAVTAAAYNPAAAKAIQKLFWGERFRVYTSSDVIGVELGGALKNVIALAAGICQGLELGQNTLAALLTRGLAEMSRLGASLGADPLTFLGLSGVGDLLLTAGAGSLSRNRAVGMRLAQGQKLEQILASTRTVAEGIKTTRSARRLARQAGVEMPICEQVHAVLYQGADPRAALNELMSRDPKLERWGLG